MANTGYLLMNLSKQMKYQLNQSLIQKGVTVQQWAVIQHLSHGEKQTATELSLALDMDKPTISGIIQRLEKKEIIEKNKSPNDSRSYLLSLTKLGVSKLKECQQLSDQILEDYLAVLTSEEQDALNLLLSKIDQENQKKAKEM